MSAAPPRRMRALTLWQPLGHAGGGRREAVRVRRWPAPKWIWGERIAIHAGARPVKRRELDELIASILLGMQARPELVPTSAVLGTAVLGRPVPAAEAAVQAYGESFRGDSDRIDHAVFGWPLTEIRRFAPPIPARGAQGFWWWSTSEADVAVEPVRVAA